MIFLSILDLSVVTTGTPPADKALRNSIDLARQCRCGLGYVALLAGRTITIGVVASPAPTSYRADCRGDEPDPGRLRWRHVAEPCAAGGGRALQDAGGAVSGRIDLGLGRAPGTDGATAHALRSRLDRREGDDFLERLHELMLWETRDFPPGHPYNNVVAMPDDAPLPPIWLLGSSDTARNLPPRSAWALPSRIILRPMTRLRR